MWVTIKVSLILIKKDFRNKIRKIKLFNAAVTLKYSQGHQKLTQQ